VQVQALLTRIAEASPHLVVYPAVVNSSSTRAVQALPSSRSSRFYLFFFFVIHI
jgi:hypothetical protein